MLELASSSATVPDKPLTFWGCTFLVLCYYCYFCFVAATITRVSLSSLWASGSSVSTKLQPTPLLPIHCAARGKSNIPDVLVIDPHWVHPSQRLRQPPRAMTLRDGSLLSAARQYELERLRTLAHPRPCRVTHQCVCAYLDAMEQHIVLSCAYK